MWNILHLVPMFIYMFVQREMNIYDHIRTILMSVITF